MSAKLEEKTTLVLPSEDEIAQVICDAGYGEGTWSKSAWNREAGHIAESVEAARRVLALLQSRVVVLPVHCDLRDEPKKSKRAIRACEIELPEVVKLANEPTAFKGRMTDPKANEILSRCTNFGGLLRWLVDTDSAELAREILDALDDTQKNEPTIAAWARALKPFTRETEMQP